MVFDNSEIHALNLILKRDPDKFKNITVMGGPEEEKEKPKQKI